MSAKRPEGPSDVVNPFDKRPNKLQWVVYQRAAMMAGHPTKTEP